jgi:hypothetical protein
VARICTVKLKIGVIHNYVRSLGWDHSENDDWVGIRADEARRAAKLTKEMVGQFWDKQSFGLELPSINGVTMHGNCDLCFLKPTHQIVSLIKEKPGALWWKDGQHAQTSDKTFGSHASAKIGRATFCYQTTRSV